MVESVNTGRPAAGISPVMPEQYSPLTLAYLGDAVFELGVRERLVRMGSRPAKEWRRLSKRLVSAAAQSAMAETLLENLTAEEADIFRRGRNANPKNTAKNASVSDYRRATGLEAVFGYLSLCGRSERIGELLDLILRPEVMQ